MFLRILNQNLNFFNETSQPALALRRSLIILSPRPPSFHTHATLDLSKASFSRVQIHSPHFHFTSAPFQAQRISYSRMNAAMPVPPPEFLCPITMELMVHPLATKHGPNFERSAIVAWLQQGSGECPLTRKPLTMSDLIHNNYLVAEIAQWRAAHGISTPLSNEAETQNRIFCRVQDACSDVNDDLHAVDLVRLQHIYGTTTLPFDTVIPATHNGLCAEAATPTAATVCPTGADTVNPSSRSRPRTLWPVSLTPKPRRRQQLAHVQVSTPAC
jgi:U-box domain